MISYKISKHNDNKLVMNTLNDALSKEKDVYRLIIHSNQGLKYTSYEHKAITLFFSSSCNGTHNIPIIGLDMFTITFLYNIINF